MRTANCTCGTLECRASMRPERFGGQHYHLARAQNDAHTRPRSRGATQSPNLDELELAHVPVVSSRIARGSPLRDGVNAVAGDFGASRNWSRPSNQISERRSDTSNSIYGSTSKSPLPTPNAHTKNVSEHCSCRKNVVHCKTKDCIVPAGENFTPGPRRKTCLRGVREDSAPLHKQTYCRN